MNYKILAISKDNSQSVRKLSFLKTIPGDNGLDGSMSYKKLFFYKPCHQ
jgi:hypothetical protein